MTRKLSFEIPDMDDRGVSPVIGVILMVAITVILAAVIASFVLGFGSSVSENVQAGASVDANDGQATVTWVSEGTADGLTVNATAGDYSAEEDIGSVGGTVSFDETDLMNNADSPTSLETASDDMDDSVTIVVTASGGDTSTVVSQETVNMSTE